MLFSWTMNNHNPYAEAFASAAKRRQQQLARQRRKRWINEQQKAERDNGALLIGIVLVLTGVLYATVALIWIL